MGEIFPIARFILRLKLLLITFANSILASFSPAYLFVTSVQNHPGFRHLSVNQIMRQLRRESD